jgi:ABC-2 type transport system ATP-binding protein
VTSDEKSAPANARPAESTGAGERRHMIEVEGLRRTFAEVVAVDDVSFHVDRGEILGFLGHNGAGKTTTVRMLTGRLRPTSGSARVAGHDVVAHRDRLKDIINAVPEEPNLYQRMTGRRLLRTFAELYGSPRERVDDMLDALGLTAVADRRVKTYSSGMKQRLLVARSLLNEPQVLFLDEPSRGLDPASARDVRTLVRERADRGVTVFLTTHYMEEADELCDRVAFLSNGKMVALDTPRELKLRYGKRTARVLLDDREEHVLRLDDAADAARLESWMAAGRVLTVHSDEGTLEDVFVDLAGRPL